MDPSLLMYELRNGQLATVRSGLLALVFGTCAVVLVMFMMSPSIGGLSGIPGHIFDGPVDAPRVASQPRMTKAQRFAARRDAVRLAATQVGVRERRPNSSPTIVAYRKAVTGRGENPRTAEPWCADFVSWVWRGAGAPIGFQGRGADYVPELVAWARLTRRWHWARDGYKPRAGDLIVYRGGGSRRGHIGLVAKLSPGRVHTIEGNYADRVMRRTVKPWAPSVTGFISPV